jgi:hypothetical protein
VSIGANRLRIRLNKLSSRKKMAKQRIPARELSRRQSPKSLQREADLLRELAIDFDWNAAAKRAGINKKTLENMLATSSGFREKCEVVIARSVNAASGVGDAIKRFQRTQEKLITALDDGDLSVSSALLKSHEMEFKMHGLFEKDNKQKGSSVSINITFENPNEKGMIEVEDIEHAE